MHITSLSDSWAWEILSMTFCIACCVALAAVLGCSHGHTTPQLPHQISLNTLASILATAAKASLLTAVAAAMGQDKWLKLRDDKAGHRASAIKLFDEASRGPVGAITLLFSGRRGRVLALLGALVIVTSVAFEAFVQQAISYPLQVIYVPSDTVQMPFVREFYEPGSANLPFLSYHAENTLLGSALGTGTVPAAIPTCPNGNCTWESYSALALCSACTDVSDFAGKSYSCDPAVGEDMVADLGENSVLVCNAITC